MVRTGSPARESAPWSCIRQLESTETTADRAGAQDRIDFGARHAARDLGEFDGKRSAESAALIRRIHFTKFEPAHVRQQTARTVFDLQFPQGVAAIVIRDDLVEARAHVFDTGDFQ